MYCCELNAVALSTCIWNGCCSAEILSVGVGLMDLWVAAIHILLVSQLHDCNGNPIYKENFQYAQSQL